MNNFKYSILIIFVIGISQAGLNAQATSDAKVDTISFHVDGVCGMCKSRIEQAVYDMKGIKSVNWDIDSGQLVAIAKAGKLTAEEVAGQIAKAGHSSELAKAAKDAYGKLPDCCKYNDGVPKHGIDRK